MWLSQRYRRVSQRTFLHSSSAKQFSKRTNQMMPFLFWIENRVLVKTEDEEENKPNFYNFIGQNFKLYKFGLFHITKYLTTAHAISL